MRAARVMVVHVPPYSDCNMGSPGDHRVVHHLKHWWPWLEIMSVTRDNIKRRHNSIGKLRNRD